jgi:hypothetical protein
MYFNQDEESDHLVVQILPAKIKAGKRFAPSGLHSG